MREMILPWWKKAHPKWWNQTMLIQQKLQNLLQEFLISLWTVPSKCQMTSFSQRMMTTSNQNKRVLRKILNLTWTFYQQPICGTNKRKLIWALKAIRYSLTIKSFLPPLLHLQILSLDHPLCSNRWSLGLHNIPMFQRETWSLLKSRR